jgi:hypothetical protein
LRREVRAPAPGPPTRDGLAVIATILTVAFVASVLVRRRSDLAAPGSGHHVPA